MANYILGILEYADMSAYNFVLNILFRTCSPVLFRQNIATEVDNFLEAVRAVTSSVQPAYFTIFCHQSELSLIQRHRFPILYAVSMAVAKDLAELHNLNTGGNVSTMNVKLMDHLPKFVDHRLYQEKTNRLHLQMTASSLGAILKMQKEYGGPGAELPQGGDGEGEPDAVTADITCKECQQQQ